MVFFRRTSMKAVFYVFIISIFNQLLESRIQSASNTVSQLISQVDMYMILSSPSHPIYQDDMNQAKNV